MSKFERDQERRFTRRALLLVGGQMSIVGILGARMFQLQVLDRDKYMTLAEDNRVNMKLIAPERGMIYDRFNVPLAINVQDFRLLMIQERTPDIQKSLDYINQIIPLSPQRRLKIMRDLKRQHTFLPVLIENNLTWEQMAAIEVALPNLPGLMIEEGKIRSYPLREATAHFVGYVGIPNEKDTKADPNPLMELPGFQIGKNGLEKQYDLLLRGVAGRADEEVNATGRKVRVLDEKKGVQGATLGLTIDAELQLFVQNRLAQERSASAVIMDAYSGAIYALASHPAFDPNVFSGAIPTALWNELLNDPAAPLRNKVIAGEYPPGSTFKMIVALAALEAGALSRHRTVFCGGSMKLGTHIFHCWKAGGHGHVDVIEALAQSCDCFFYQMSLDIGIDKIAAMARRLGLGSKLGIDIQGERPGLIPDQQWKKEKLKQPWHKGESLVNAIGQGFTTSTPLQLATMLARIVNGGLPVQPYLAERSGDQMLKRQTIGPSIGLNPEHVALVKQGMDAVVNSSTGTAKGAAIKDETMLFGGKTGTSQVRRITMEQRRAGFKSSDLKWEEQHHALFVGYAPLETPRYICAVVIEHGGSGAGAAAPFARDILLETQKRQPDKKQNRG